MIFVGAGLAISHRRAADVRLSWRPGQGGTLAPAQVQANGVPALGDHKSRPYEQIFMSNFWKSARRWLPGVIISLAVIAAILYFVDLRSLAEAIRSADYRLLLASLAISVGWLAVRGIVWRTLLRARASSRDVFLTLCEGYLLNNFLPFRLGEFGRAFLLGRKSGLGFMEILPTIVIERVLDLAFSAAILLSVVPFVVGAAGAEQVAYIVGGVMLVGLASLYFLARYRNWAMRQFDRLSKRWPGLHKRSGNFLESMFSGLAILMDGWLFVRALFWMILNWAIAILQFYLVLLAFFPHAQPMWAMFGLGAAAFGGAIPSLPGAVGIYDGALGGALALVTGDQATSLATALIAHLFSYLVYGILGAYALSTEGETLMGVYRQLRRRQEE
ncbi:MAG: flippase-like domain-containing protein [Anaerolineales bacterium]|nr:flippase-like domain-containing protein [Anaerolineales bacterium]